MRKIVLFVCEGYAPRPQDVIKGAYPETNTLPKQPYPSALRRGWLLLLLFIIFLSCNKISVEAQSLQVNYMYVDSLDGLRVRNSPDRRGERIGLLENKTRVEVLQVDNEKINIDGILGNWMLIKTTNIQGWVFSGFLVQNVNDISDNWIICKSYRYRGRPYPMSIEQTNSSNTMAFEFIAKSLKNYFYPNVTTKDFYLSFFYPLERYIPKFRNGLFEETDVEIQGLTTDHYFRYNSQINGENSYLITISQYKNDILNREIQFIKEMQFTIIFYEDYIECPELISDELAQRIKIFDSAEHDLELKIDNAYHSQDSYELNEGIYMEVTVEIYDFYEILDTDYSKIYMDILQRNGIILTEMEIEIFNRRLYYVKLKYK